MSLAETIAEPIARRTDADRDLTSKVLLLGNDDRVVLAVARGLGREGISVDVAWCSQSSPALKSVYVSEFHQLPPYSADSFDWLAALNELVRAQGYDLVIPCNDFAVIPLQNARERLDANTNWYLLDDRAFGIAFDKAKTGSLASDLGINTPTEFALSQKQVRSVSDQNEVHSLDGNKLSFPVYTKPHSSVTQTDVEHKRSAHRIETPHGLADALREDCPPDGLLIQEHFAGQGVGVEVLASEGKVLMQFQHRRLRETIDGGSTYRESIAEIPELTEATHKMVEQLNYTGVAMFEYRYNADTCDWVFLEINARFWGSLPLAIAAGANFPFALHQLLVHGKQEFDSNHRVGPRCRNLITDLRACRRQPGAKIHALRILFGSDHLDFFAKDDWRPQIATLGELASSLVRKVVRK